MMKIAVVVAIAVLGMSARGAQKVTVYLENSANAPSVVLSQARTMAAEMFNGVDVGIDWRAGRPSDSLLQRERAIAVRLAANTPKEFRPGASAFALPAEGVHITVLYDRLAWSLQKPSLAPVLLAHVLVHEITHILEAIPRHSETGVMKADWTEQDLYEMRRKPLPFAPEDIDLIQRGLAWRASREAH